MKLLEYCNEVELNHLMNDLARRLEDGCAINGIEKPMFALVLFNDPKMGQYCSNCNREQVIGALQELTERLVKKQDFPRIERRTDETS